MSGKNVISKEVERLYSRWGLHITEKVRILSKRSCKSIILKEVGPLNSRWGPNKKEKVRILSKTSSETVISKETKLVNSRWGPQILVREKVRLLSNRSAKTVVFFSKEAGPLNSRSVPHIREKVLIFVLNVRQNCNLKRSWTT